METPNGKKLIGTVVSDKMNKTLVVLVKTFTKHPQYGKYITKTKRYKVHDENKTAKMGDTVTIKECRPLSKDKNFTLVSVNNK